MIKATLIKQTGFVVMLTVYLLAAGTLQAQRKPAAGAKKAGTGQVKKPAAGQVKKPSTSQVNKPAATAAKKPMAPKTGANNTKPSTTSAAGSKSLPGKGSGNTINNGDRQIGDNNSNNRNTNISGNKNVSGNNVNINIDNSKNIHVKNNRNTVVRRNHYNRPYGRPPYVYGGYRYRCYHPYYYHPYRPFVWGPRWHPWGFFVATLATTAIIVSFADADLPPLNPDQEILTYVSAPVADETGIAISAPFLVYVEQSENKVSTPAVDEFYYDDGVFYEKSEGGYTVIAAPVGGIIKTLPMGYETVIIDEESGATNFYFGGAFYEEHAKGFIVVPPTAGTVVEHISEGGEEVKLGEITYVKLGETYYQPIQKSGKNVYEVADVEEDK